MPITDLTEQNLLDCLLKYQQSKTSYSTEFALIFSVLLELRAKLEFLEEKIEEVINKSEV